MMKRRKKIIEEDAMTKYLSSTWLWKNLLQQKNACIYSRQGAAGEQQTAQERAHGKQGEMKHEEEEFKSSEKQRTQCH